MKTNFEKVIDFNLNFGVLSSASIVPKPSVLNEDPKMVEEKAGAQVDDTVFFQAYLGRGWHQPSTDDAVMKISSLINKYHKHYNYKCLG